MTKITFADANDIVFSVPLDNVKYKIRMLWNKEAAAWSLHLWDANENVILSNIRVVPNFPLLLNHHVKTAPLGELLVLTDKEDVNRNSFADGSAILVYSSYDEFYG